MNIVTKLLTYQNQVKIFHWQTTSYSEHASLGELYDSLSESIDEFVEVFMGKYGRIFAQNNFSLTLQNYNDVSPLTILTEMSNFLSNDIPKQLPNSENNSDLLNIRDEILASVNKTLYLLTLK